MDGVAAKPFESEAELLQKARERFRDAIQADERNRRLAEEDLRFFAGEQWDRADIDARAKAGRPCLTINLLPQFVRQVVNEARIKPPSISVRPVDNGADRRIAEIYTGLIRAIENASKAEHAYTQALEHAVVCGIGHFRIKTVYSKDDGFDLDIAIEPIRSPFAVVWDPFASDPQRKDARYCFVTEMIPEDDFKVMFPEQSPSSWDPEASEWWWDETRRQVRVAEYWFKMPAVKTLVHLVTGETFQAENVPPELMQELRANGMIARERKIDCPSVFQVLLSGGAILSGPNEWPSHQFPIVPVIGEEIFVGGGTLRRGLIRNARDAQRMFNLHRSALAESAAIAPKFKWLLTPAQVAGHELAWARAHVSNHVYLLYNPDAQAPPPQRIAPDIPAQALLNEVQMAAADIEATTGIYRASLGRESNERSGRAIIARQREGDVGTFHFIDNLARAIVQAGDILVEIIPKVYDNARIVRSLGEDGKEKFVQINIPLPDGRKLNDLSVGKYDVVVTVAPSYTTKREEARDSMLTLAQAYPGIMQVAPDLIVEAMDWPDADKIAARLRKTLPPGMVEPRPGEVLPQPQPTPESIIAQAELIKAQADAQKAVADAELKRVSLAIEAEKARQQGVDIENRGNAAAVKAITEYVRMRNDQRRTALEIQRSQNGTQTQ